MDQSEREAAIEANRTEYGEAYQHMRWVTEEEAVRAEEERARLLDSLRGRAAWGYGATKADCRSLSPGCRCCGAGSWSCLFVNGLCNAHCYYCPSEQREVGEPATNTLPFPSPEAYGAYLRRFGIRGSSMSGGEPLLTLDRTLRFLEQAGRAVGPEGHLWMYTNGLLLTGEKLELLVEAGLKEIRIDLTANDYDLTPVRIAAGKLPVVTVEIPALPEDAERLRGLLPELAASGVCYLNLHELRATPYNLPRLARRGHAFRHGRRVTVMGSELAALSALESTVERGIDLPVNYCSCIYKSLHQGRAARSRAAEAARTPRESVTEAGYIRETWVTGSAEELTILERELAAAGRDPALWALDAGGGRLSLHASLVGLVAGRLSASARYHEAVLRAGASYHAAFREIELEGGSSIVAERRPVGEVSPVPPGLACYERLPEGLVPYF